MDCGQDITNPRAPPRRYNPGNRSRATHSSQEAAMTVKIRQIGPCFAGEVEGVDMSRPQTAEEVAAIHAGMDRYAVLVFHDQHITDEQHLAFTVSLGDIEHAIGTSLRRPDEYRLPTTFADVSNLDKHNQVYARDDRR